MSDRWKPGDKAIVFEPGSVRDRSPVWLLADMDRCEGDSRDATWWTVADRPGGGAADQFPESSLRRPEDVSNGGWFDGAPVVYLALAGVVGLMLWAFYLISGGR